MIACACVLCFDVFDDMYHGVENRLTVALGRRRKLPRV